MAVPSKKISTWRERIGQTAEFPLHLATDVERAMVAEIADLRADATAMENVALNEWFAKTDWVQQQESTFPLSRLGKHRADVMREEIERLRVFERRARVSAAGALSAQIQESAQSAAATDEQWIFDLAAKYEIPAARQWGNVRFSASGLVEFVRAALEARPAGLTETTQETTN
jgi:hypothetical protein